jgi:hypothetical protein
MYGTYPHQSCLLGLHHKSANSDKKRGNCTADGLIEVLSAIRNAILQLERGLKPIEAYKHVYTRRTYGKLLRPTWVDPRCVGRDRWK